MTITDEKLKEILFNIRFIDTSQWEYDYDICEIWSKTNKELCIYDDDNEDYYFDVDISVYKNHEEYIIDWECTFNYCYKNGLEAIELTEEQIDMLINEIGTALY